MTSAPASMPKPKLPWFCLTPDRFIFGLLLVEVVLVLSEQFHWFAFNERKGMTLLIAVGVLCVALLFLLLWFIAALIARRQFQYGLRSLLVLTTVVAILCSWFTVKMKQAKRQKDAVIAIRADGGVLYDYQCDDCGVSIKGAKPYVPAWLCNLLGEDFFANVRWVGFSSYDFGPADMADLETLSHVQIAYFRDCRMTDADLTTLGRLTKLRRLILQQTPITDDKLQHLTSLTKLQFLEISGTQITDKGIEHLTSLSQLQSLDLNNTEITDQVAKRLKELPSLQRINLNHTNFSDQGLFLIRDLSRLRELRLDSSQITDAGVVYIRHLNNLKELVLTGTSVSDAAIPDLSTIRTLKRLDVRRTSITPNGCKKLQNALPNCNVWWQAKNPPVKSSSQDQD